jgi:hypothetical protein
MIKILFPLTLLALIFSTACSGKLSDTAVQTAVSQAIMTSSAEEASLGTTIQDNQGIDAQTKAELEQVKTELSDAQVKLTEQANKVAELQDELDHLYPLLTPTNTIEPLETPTPTNTATVQPSLTPTQNNGLLYNQKYVVTTVGAALYTYTEKNKSGFPIMVKTDPVVKFGVGEVIVVERYLVRADGSLNFYLVIGPTNSGLYILASEVSDYTG